MGVYTLSAQGLAEIVSLRLLTGGDLAPVLDEETECWREMLDWDFRASADLVRQFVDMRSLSGFALVAGGEPAGYVYTITEERKGLIGDLYVRERYRTWKNEDRLLTAAIDSLLGEHGMRRIESQLMMLSAPLTRPLPYERTARRFDRTFMVCRSKRVVRPRAAAAHLEPWRDALVDDAAGLIAASYRGHVDAEINDQYRSASGARQFLLNIVQYPGCGRFCQPASFLAVHRTSGRALGLILASLVAETTGHITQVCVAPQARGQGLGRELVERSMEVLFALGAERVSLTVTSSNTGAIQLYERLGFACSRQFGAHVWEAPRTVGF